MTSTLQTFSSESQQCNTKIQEVERQIAALNAQLDELKSKKSRLSEVEQIFSQLEQDVTLVNGEVKDRIISNLNALSEIIAKKLDFKPSKPKVSSGKTRNRAKIHEVSENIIYKEYSDEALNCAYIGFEGENSEKISQIYKNAIVEHNYALEVTLDKSQDIKKQLGKQYNHILKLEGTTLDKVEEISKIDISTLSKDIPKPQVQRPIPSNTKS